VHAEQIELAQRGRDRAVEGAGLEVLLDVREVPLGDVAGDRLLDQPLLVSQLPIDLEEVPRDFVQLSGRIDGVLLGRGLGSAAVWTCRGRIPRP
jgi:hypothetical protein